MKMYFKQRFFSWLDSYDIYDENDCVLYTVKGQLAFGHCFIIYDSSGNEVGTLRQKFFSFLPKFEIYKKDTYVGNIRKELSFMSNNYTIDYRDWNIRGNFMAWDYEITDNYGNNIATISKELFHMTDHYLIDVNNPADALDTLMFVLAIDAEKCSDD